MPSIEITDHAMNYLKSLAEPFIDTPATVLDRIIGQHQKLMLTGKSSADAVGPARTEFRIENLPPLLHAKVESAKIDGSTVPRPKWSTLVEEMIRRTAAKGVSGADIAASMNAHTELRKREDTGFVFIKEAGMSFQKMDANRSCKAILAISRKYRIPVSLDFFWGDDPKAHNPGGNGRIVGP